MVTEPADRSRHSVVCLYCGASTLLSPSHEQILLAGDHAGASRKSPVLLIRCRLCFKEAPYGRQNIAVFAA